MGSTTAVSNGHACVLSFSFLLFSFSPQDALLQRLILLDTTATSPMVPDKGVVLVSRYLSYVYFCSL